MPFAPVLRAVGMAAGGAVLNEVFNMFPGIFGMEDASYSATSVTAAKNGQLVAYSLGQENPGGSIGNLSGNPNFGADNKERKRALNYWKMGMSWCMTRWQVDEAGCASQLKQTLPYVLAGVRAFKNTNSSYTVQPLLTSTSGANEMAALMTEMDNLYDYGLRATGGAGGAFVPGAGTGLQGGVPSELELPQQQGGGSFAQGGQFLNQAGGAMCGVRPASTVQVQGPDGKIYWYGYLGQPILWSRDASTARRVGRIAKRVARDVGLTTRRRGMATGRKTTRRS